MAELPQETIKKIQDEAYDRGYAQGKIVGHVEYRTALIELSNSLNKLSGRKVTVDEIVEILEREVWYDNTRSNRFNKTI